MGSFPYHSHIFRDSYGSGMGIVWEAYHKGVPLLGVPENPIDNFNTKKNHQTPPVLIDQVARCPKSFHDLKPWFGWCEPPSPCYLPLLVIKDRENGSSLITCPVVEKLCSWLSFHRENGGKTLGMGAP